MNLRIETIKGAAHYIAEEKPEAVEELIERYAGTDAAQPVVACRSLESPAPLACSAAGC